MYSLPRLPLCAPTARLLRDGMMPPSILTPASPDTLLCSPALPSAKFEDDYCFKVTLDGQRICAPRTGATVSCRVCHGTGSELVLHQAQSNLAYAVAWGLISETCQGMPCDALVMTMQHANTMDIDPGHTHMP